MTLDTHEVQASTTLGSFFKYIMVINGSRVEFANTQHELVEIRKSLNADATIDVYETLPRTALSRKGKQK